MKCRNGKLQHWPLNFMKHLKKLSKWSTCSYLSSSSISVCLHLLWLSAGRCWGQCAGRHAAGDKHESASYFRAASADSDMRMWQRASGSPRWSLTYNPMIFRETVSRREVRPTRNKSLLVTPLYKRGTGWVHSLQATSVPFLRTSRHTNAHSDKLDSHVGHTSSMP